MDQTTPQNEPTNKKSLGIKRLVLIIAGLVLLVATGLLGYLYWSERTNSSNLQKQLDTAKTPSKTNDSSPQLAPAKATYTASIGKFTLTLDQVYYIIVDLDGGFEGGPATRLAIATRNNEGQQTVTSPSHSRVTVDAYPINEANGYASRVENALADADNTKQPSVKVDGVDAEVYQIDGLFTDKKLFFTKNNIFYEITAHSSDANEGTLNAVIKGFKFNN